MRGPDYILNWLIEWLEAAIWPGFPRNSTPLKSPKYPQKPCRKPKSEKKKKKWY
jgi:hypothetical protein